MEVIENKIYKYTDYLNIHTAREQHAEMAGFFDARNQERIYVRLFTEIIEDLNKIKEVCSYENV